MRSLTIAGAMEGDSLPSGAYVVNFWDHERLEIVGPVGVQPPQKIRYPRLSEDGISIAGQGQEFGTWDWNGANWLEYGPCSGTSPVIFDARGILHIVRPGPDVTSQGYRCLDSAGNPVLGDDTMAIDVAGRLLHEYTPIDTMLGRILIGQDHESGVHVIAQGVRHWLTDHLGNPIDGDTHWVRARVAGSTLAVTVSRFDQRSVIHVLMDLSEIALLPVVTAEPPDKEPDDKEPDDKEPTVSVPNLFGVVQGVWNGGGHELVTKEGCGRFTHACALALNAADGNFGHLKKNPGQNQIDGHAVDAVLHRATGFAIDLISSSESDNAKPAWQVKEDLSYPASAWMLPQGAVKEPTGGGGSGSGGTKDPRVDSLIADVRSITQQLDGFDGGWFRQKIADEDEAIDKLTKRVDRLPSGGGGSLPAGTELTLEVSLFGRSTHVKAKVV